MSYEKMPSNQEPEQLEFEVKPHVMSIENIVTRLKGDASFQVMWKNEEALQDKANAIQQIMDEIRIDKSFQNIWNEPKKIYAYAIATEGVLPERDVPDDRFDPDLHR